MITYESISKNGERDYNEDYTGIANNGNEWCFVLADGLGGHGGGGEASRLVAEHILDDFSVRGEVSEEYLRKCFEDSQKALLKEQERQKREYEMKTTLVILLLDEEKMQWGHIGDSRLYLWRGNKYQQRTLDHSVPQMLVASGEIREEQIRGHADRNRLLRVMGTEWDSPRYNISDPMESKGAQLLLCTDGFWEWVDEKAMKSSLKKSKTPAEWLEKLEQEVKKNGTGKGMDNYSAITVFVQ